MIYVIDNDKKFSDEDKAAYYITENMSDDAYDEMLDDCYGDVNIGGCEYSTSIALYRVDEVAYRCGKNDYYDGLARDISYDIGKMYGGDTQNFYDFDVEAYDDEELEADIEELEEELAESEDEEEKADLTKQIEELKQNLDELRKGVDE